MTNSGKSQQGEGSGGRGLADVTQVSEGWTSAPLFPPPHVMATLRIAYIAETGHAQWQFEVSDPITSELLAMSSVPHRDASGYQDALQQAFVDLHRRWEDVCNPDPF